MATIGVIGAGQLGRMLGFAGNGLGFEFVFLDPAPDPPAAAAGRVISQAFDSVDGLSELARVSDVVTYEFENVPVDAVESIMGEVPVYPPPAALRCAQDRLVEKSLFRTLGIPVPGFQAVGGAEELHVAASTLGLPLVLKTRRFGYDGKGQQLIRDESEIEAAFGALADQPLIAEQWVPFEREVSAIGVRSGNGDSAFYPLTENRHEGGILRTSRAPVETAGLTGQAVGHLEKLMRHLDYVGVLALELFVADGRLIANEYAPRVHNSGHWTIEGAITSQFENHVRAVLSMPPGNPSPRGHAAMINLIGRMPKDPEKLTAAGWIIHDYGKSARPGRKLGHATLVRDTAEDRDEGLEDGLARCGP